MAKKEKIPDRIGTQGWQQFLATKQEMLYQFDLAKIYAESHIVKVSHGHVAESTFRRWLANFLPKKYGVTAGYIVSQNREFVDINLPHYDVIIYDQLNSPTLWIEENSDHSENGKTRAIPAEFVRGVFEVKSNLTEETSLKALNKLLELKPLLYEKQDDNKYGGKLHESFFSATVFFELQKVNEFKSIILDNLVTTSVFPFYGGVILKAEGRDINDTGRISMHNSDTEYPTKDNSCKESLIFEMPTSNTKKKFTDSYILTLLSWSPVYFSHFAFDIIACLEGTFKPGYASSNYGYSWNNPERNKIN